MSLKPVSPGLRTIHNGSNSLVKAQINVPVGGELTVPEVVAAQLQRDSTAFKNGPATDAIKTLAEQLDAPSAEPLTLELEAEPEPVKAASSTKKPKR